jgi:short-subunit dehydrogenase
MNNTLIVSGGSKGIGRAVVLKFASEGFDIITCSRNGQDLADLKQHVESRYGVKCHVVEADFEKKESVIAFAKEVKHQCPNPTVLVNNAGIFQPGSVLEEQDGVFEQLLQVNLASAYHLSREIIPSMKKVSRAHVFNICSTASIVPYVNGGSYCISKFALLGMSKVLREELKKERIAVSAILPGATYTTSWEGSGLPESRFMPADDIAQAIFNAWNFNEHTVMEEILLRPHEGDI